MLAIRTEDNKVFKQISTPAFEDRVIADGGVVSSVDNTDKVLDDIAAAGINPSVVMVPSGTKATKLYSQIPYGGSADFTVTRSGATGMRLNNGYWQPVSADTPRVDLTWNEATQMFEEYLNVEPAATNLITYYKSFANSYWTKSGTSIQGDPNTAGAEKAVNGGFDSDTTWVKEGTWTISGGTANRTAQASSYQMYETSVLTVGKLYMLTYTVLNYSAGTVRIMAGSSSPGVLRSANGTYTEYLVASSTAILLEANAAFAGSVDNVSAKEVTGFNCPFVDSSGANLMSGYKLVESSANAAHYINSATASLSGSHSVQIFAKKVESGRYLQVLFNGVFGSPIGTNILANIDLDTGQVTKTVQCTATVTASVDGWWKINVFASLVAGSAPSIYFSIINSSTANAFSSYLGDGTSGILIAHAQLEAGTVATSPIGGAEGSSQTRNADSIVKTGASALIGQTEGYMVVEVNISKLLGLTARGVISLSYDSDVSNRVNILFTSLGSNTIRFIINSGSNDSVDYRYEVTQVGLLKIGVAWKNNDSIMYVNGNAATLVLNGVVSFTNQLGKISLGALQNALTQLSDRIKITHMGQTRLSNAELAALTTL